MGCNSTQIFIPSLLFISVVKEWALQYFTWHSMTSFNIAAFILFTSYDFFLFFLTFFACFLIYLRANLSVSVIQPTSEYTIEYTIFILKEIAVIVRLSYITESRFNRLQKLYLKRNVTLIRNFNELMIWHTGCSHLIPNHIIKLILTLWNWRK